ncbi:LysR family transcriptional regulator [Paraglaciecola aquimarina]|uniref:LysR family transcriptional regulator n=1 Tax=Paraglaciecola aquimarina TaxID=1235557 RepID=A0ABU3SS76_9ALTE|nr:LysR family transcriptional regulator [Paraglaciecola aquimarina]MDU0352851.1 LysR family transcriptional regulator [Paraglaciecola aquimarina]
MINTNWLHTFCTLIEVGQFTRTAEKLHMTQSGVSQHIHKLEEQLGVTLLDRQGKTFTLSTAGQKLYKEAGKILTDLTNLQQSVVNDPAFEGHVRVMSPGSLGLKLYPQLLTLQQRYPKLIIDFRFAPNSDIEQAIVNAKIDFGFMTIKSKLVDVCCQPIAKEPLLLVTPSTIEQPNWSTLEALGFIGHPDGSHHANLLLSQNFPQFQHSNLFTKTGFSNQIGLILEPVSLGLGFTVLPKHAVDAFSPSSKIKIHPLPIPVSETLFLCTRRGIKLPKRIDTVIAEAKKSLQAEQVLGE